MRTTLTLEPDVAKMIEEQVHRVRQPFKRVVNDALRRGLAPNVGGPQGKPYRVRPHTATLLPGIDRGRLNALADELEDEAIVERARGGKRA